MPLKGKAILRKIRRSIGLTEGYAGEVQSRGMKAKIRPFPEPPAAAPAGDRIVLNIGKQRIAFEISCKAQVLDPAPEVIEMPPVKGRKGGERRRHD